jgi:hypothetical protein
MSRGYRDERRRNGIGGVRRYIPSPSLWSPTSVVSSGLLLRSCRGGYVVGVAVQTKGLGERFRFSV